MAYPIPLESMTLEEKLQTMETIWDDLCRKDTEFTSPAWHKDVLADRETAMQQGGDGFIDWETAKKNIRNEVK